MLQRDYFIRLIEEFLAAVSRFLEKDVDKRTDADLQDLYRRYVGDYDVLRNLSFAEAVGYGRNEWDELRRMQKLEMLAELWYTEGSYKQNPLRDLLLEKAFRMFDYVDRHSSSYSITRKQKMEKIKAVLGVRLQLTDIL